MAGDQISISDFVVTALFYSYCFNDNMKVDITLVVKFRENLLTKGYLVTWLNNMTEQLGEYFKNRPAAPI
jgi:outer membrane protein W